MTINTIHRDLSKYTDIVFQNNYFLDELSGVDNYSRSLKMCIDIDTAIIIGGRVGTMYEITLLSGMSKDFYVLENSGGVANDTIKCFAKEGHKSKSNIIFIKSPEELAKYV